MTHTHKTHCPLCGKVTGGCIVASCNMPPTTGTEPCDSCQEKNAMSEEPKTDGSNGSGEDGATPVQKVERIEDLKLSPNMKVNQTNLREVVFDCPWTGHVSTDELIHHVKGTPYEGRPYIKCGAMVYRKKEAPMIATPPGLLVKP